MPGSARAKVGAVLGAVLLLCLFVVATAIWIGDRYVGYAYRHVVVEISNVAGIARVDVDCRRAESVEAGEGPKRVDLGWLSPGERIFLSEYNERGAAAWGFKVIVNGEVVREFNKGHAGVTGKETGPYAVAMAKQISADGNVVGSIGCGLSGLVSKSLGDYQQSPQARALLKRKDPPLLRRWDPPRSPYASIESLAGLVPAFALVGFVTAFSLARVREWIFSHGIVAAVTGLLSLINGFLKTLGPGALLVAFEGLGLLLLLLSAVLLAWPHTGSRWLTSSSTPAPKPNPE
jgi:hypothetical protein